jgi:hypothetical protein
MNLLAEALRRCGRELAAPGPPTTRLQPVHDLVIQACKEYDKGAGCLADAVRIWNLPEGRNPDTIGKAIDCGLGVQQAGGKLLSDASIAGLKITTPS